MASNAGGQGNGLALSVREEMAIFDALPVGAKEIVWNFAYPLSAPAVAAQCFAHKAKRYEPLPQSFVDMNRAVLPRFRDAQILSKYGADHPMIGQPLREDWS